MLKIIAYIAIGICLIAIVYSLKIYWESPDISDKKRKKKIY